MAEIEVKLGPPRGMMGKLGKGMESEESESESEDSGMLEEACAAVYDALKADDKEAFVEALTTALTCC